MTFEHNGFVNISHDGKDDFISEYTFQEKTQEQNQEVIKWKVIYNILEVVEVDGKFGKSKILTMKDRQGRNPK